MDIYEYEIKGATHNDVNNETLFVIAAARADGASAVCFRLSDENKRLIPHIKRILRRMKRRSLIQMLASNEDFENNTTEAEFLLNKFPGLDARSSTNLVYAKL